MPPLSKYSRLRTEDDETPGSTCTNGPRGTLKEQFDIVESLSQRRPDIRLSLWLTHGAAFCLGVVVSLTMVFAWTRAPVVRALCTEVLSTYCERGSSWLSIRCCADYCHRAPAPANEAVEYEAVTFNGSLIFDSVYRGQPSPEVDEAWHKISNAGTFSFVPLSKTTTHGRGKSRVIAFPIAARRAA